MNVVLRKTVDGINDWGLDNLSQSHHQSEMKNCFRSNVPGLLRRKLIGQFSRDVIVS